MTSNTLAGGRYLIQGGQFTYTVNNTRVGTQGTRDKLREHSAPAAFHNSKERVNPPKCHPRTRESIRQTILNFSDDPTAFSALILWLYGPAGAGKSAIFQTIAEALHQKHRLAASFFFSRLSTSSHRHHEGRLVTTIAYHLIQHIPVVCPYIEDAVDNNPAIFDVSLNDQVDLLILKPFQQLREAQPLEIKSLPCTIIVDGLDECNDERAQATALNALLRLVSRQDIFPFTVLVASRPEPHIRYWFGEQAHYRISLQDSRDKDADIWLFTAETMAKIAGSHPFKHHLPPGWPSKELILFIVRKSSGQFIYATTVLRYIGDPRGIPSKRLESIIQQARLPKNDRPYADLDGLYLHILRKADNIEEVVSLLALQLTYPSAPAQYDYRYAGQLLSLSFPPDVLLTDLHSIIDPQPLSNTPLRFYHASLADFLTDRNRAPDDLFIDTQEWRLKLFHMVFGQLQEYLPQQPNIEGLLGPNYVDWLWYLNCQYIRTMAPTSNMRETILNWSTIDVSVAQSIVERHWFQQLFDSIQESKLVDPHVPLDTVITGAFLPPAQRMLSQYHQLQPMLPPELLIISSMCRGGWYWCPPQREKGVAPDEYKLVNYVHTNLTKEHGDIGRLFTDGAYDPFAYYNIQTFVWRDFVNFMEIRVSSKHVKTTIPPMFSPNEYMAAAVYYLQALRNCLVDGVCDEGQLVPGPELQPGHVFSNSLDFACLLNSSSLSMRLASEIRKTRAPIPALYSDPNLRTYLNIFDQCKRRGLDLASLPPHPYHRDQYPAEYVGEHLAGRRSNPSSVITSWTQGEQICQCKGGKRIYLALNNRSGEMIAVKQVKHPETSCDNMENSVNNMVRALQKDFYALQNLDHPNLLKYLGFEQNPETVNLFMDYVPGGSIESWLNRHGSFGPTVAKCFSAQILNGLEHIHSKGITHRVQFSSFQLTFAQNLKTANILIEMSGLCKISNFEMSKSMLQQKRVHAHLKGSLYWMAPEMVEDDPDQPGYDEKVDIWSLGCLVHEMWTADRPWRNVATAEVLQQLREKKSPPFPEEAVLQMPDAQDFNSLCFQSDPNNRPAASVLVQHPYLELPPHWVFQGFLS